MGNNCVIANLVPDTPTKWILRLDEPHDPFYNMAVDEVLFQSCATNNLPILRIYSWDQPSISIGYSQKYDSVKKGLRIIVRRPTGGGIVMHGDDLCYTIAVPPVHWLYELKRRQSYKVIGSIITQTLLQLNFLAYSAEESLNKISDKSSFLCFSHPAKHDVLVDGEKVAGSAQKRNQSGILHQGSLFISKLNSPNAHKRFTDQFITMMQRMLNCSFVDYESTCESELAINKLITEKYQNNRWNKKR